MEHIAYNKYITYCLTALGYIPACFVGISLESYSILAGLILVDISSGIFADIVTKGGKSIKSSILRDGLVKKGHAFIIPWLITIGGHGVGMDLLAVAKAILGGLILSEMYSILGNIYSIYTKEEKPEWDGVAFVMKRTIQIVKNIIKSIMKQ